MPQHMFNFRKLSLSNIKRSLFFICSVQCCLYDNQIMFVDFVFGKLLYVSKFLSSCSVIETFENLLLNYLKISKHNWGLTYLSYRGSSVLYIFNSSHQIHAIPLLSIPNRITMICLGKVTQCSDDLPLIPHDLELRTFCALRFCQKVVFTWQTTNFGLVCVIVVQWILYYLSYE